MPSFHDSIEQAVVIGCSAARMIAPSELREWVDDDVVANSRLYIVARRPRLTFTAARAADDGYTELRLQTPQNGPVVQTFVRTDPPFELTAEEGGQWLTLSVDDDVIFDDRPSRLLHSKEIPVEGNALDVAHVEDDLLNLEVLYVGKSNDDGGVIRRRLTAHSTLQQILADHFDHAPDYEIWVLPLVFDELSTLTAIVPNAGTDKKSAAERVAAMSPTLSAEVRVALAEAAMIRYFDPEYNTHYRASFPDRQHMSYADVFQYDYNSLGFVLNIGAALNVTIGSGAVPGAAHHEEWFAVDKPSERLPLTPENLLNSLKPTAVRVD
ncbi:hypothetical protein [Curtobacterium sp. MCBA15_013]|uniref:hypothetical protein n=1 Tax=Curtobacterium sp. MCBA15_013 TaxID=1898739 RepID=UPI0009163815|nr:hypothetical protein [Curtobacterium sp. MCBA15_013]OII18432.1 hypothetical protein BIV01_02495 [Curtobacterium sp. MCBA15_013]